jgi:hypothetical protein
VRLAAQILCKKTPLDARWVFYYSRDALDQAAHDLLHDVHPGIVFSGIVVPVLARRLVRCDLLQPAVAVMVQARSTVLMKSEALMRVIADLAEALK